jgi:translation initiation factor 4E
MYNNMYSVSEIISNTDYLLFKKGIRPEWEDPENKHGGKWVITMPIEDDLEEDCERAWLQLILHVISGQFTKEQRAVINGIVFSIRDKHFRLSVWVSVSKEIALLQGIGYRLREITQLDPQYRFGFQEHQKAIKHDLDNQNFLEV